ncbi:MAG: CRISPR-associated endonuclease Cas1 [Candidatus Poribacteria bacterium]|nr:CRISPR-associated endonuclease Cas1 [Candidatus Poribacteria bacterium]
MNQLTISDYGTYLGKHSERVSVRYRDKERKKEEHALMDLDQIVIASRGVSVSSDLIEACTERGIEISFLSFNGKPYAKLNSPSLTATVISRREQLAAYHDARGLEIAKRFAAGKLKNQVNLVRYFGKYRKKQAPKKYTELMERIGKIEAILSELSALETPADTTTPVDAMRSTLLNLEGRAGALYWECVQRLLPAGRFNTRNHRGAVDDVNALLNYGYGILYSQVWSALSLAGLEPFAGFLHVDRPGKPSLVLDFIEEFRQSVVDRVVFAMINKRFNVGWEEPDSEAAKAAHQSSKSDSAADTPSQRRLSRETRRAIADRVLGRLQETERFERKEQKLCNIIQLQARHLAMFLRRERDYQPFIATW